MANKQDDQASRPDADNPEWTRGEIRQARPALAVIAEVFGAEAAEAIKRRPGRPEKANELLSMSEDASFSMPKRRQGEARKVVMQHYPFLCCVICGSQMPAALTVAHLDHQPGNNDPDNLAWLCGTHHWMFDCALYPIEAVKLMRACWQETGGVPNHSGRMKQAGQSLLKRKGSKKSRGIAVKARNRLGRKGERVPRRQFRTGSSRSERNR